MRAGIAPPPSDGVSCRSKKGPKPRVDSGGIVGCVLTWIRTENGDRGVLLESPDQHDVLARLAVREVDAAPVSRPFHAGDVAGLEVGQGDRAASVRVGHPE